MIEWAKQRIPRPYQRRLQNLRLSMRSPLARFRGLPSFLVIGAQRCGTSSLYKYLEQHPQVYAAARKETEYLSTSHSRGELWYRSHFLLDIRMSMAARVRGSKSLAFEATPDYMLDPRAPQRASDLLPEIRLIALVRNPIDRAYSHYLHNRQLNQEHLSFEDALEAEPERIRGEMVRLLDDPLYRARSLRRYSYVTRGHYAEQIERWHEFFSPTRLLIVHSEALFREPADGFARILKFLELDPWAPRRFENFSRRRTEPKSSPGLKLETRQRLAMEFRSPNASLYKMINSNLGWELPQEPERGGVAAVL